MPHKSSRAFNLPYITRRELCKIRVLVPNVGKEQRSYRPHSAIGSWHNCHPSRRCGGERGDDNPALCFDDMSRSAQRRPVHSEKQKEIFVLANATDDTRPHQSTGGNANVKIFRGLYNEPPAILVPTIANWLCVRIMMPISPATGNRRRKTHQGNG